MDGNWYYAQDNSSFGPFSWEAFRDVAASGKLRRTSTVWREGMTEGVAASAVNRLFPEAPAPLRGSERPVVGLVACRVGAAEGSGQGVPGQVRPALRPRLGREALAALAH